MSHAYDTNPELFNELVAEAKVAAKLLVFRLMDNLPQETLNLMVALQAGGWRTGLEITCDAQERFEIVLTGVSPQGERRPFATVDSGARTAEH